jgi:NADPH-dependent 2,4-dienoyl-CoA reductase/sulfur reductase-like enzyme
MKAVPRELTVAEIERLIDAFAAGARRAKEAGFDAVEIHGAHGYLLCQFLSPYSNKRTDVYGGSLENRMRFSLDVVARIKETVGPDFSLLFRFSAEEYVPGGLTLEETRVFAQRLQGAGVHGLDVSAGNYGAVHRMIQPGSAPRGCLAPLAGEIKKVVDIPVTVAGRMNDPVLADAILHEGKADFISLGRPLLADPEYPNKAKEGRFEDIRRCTACYHCFDMEIARAEPLHCAINASAGREAESVLSRAPKAKSVVVIGGGPGGMEAARVAALRGHSVTLYEKEPALGGQLLAASLPPGKGELATTITFLEAQLVKSGVEVKRGQQARVESIVSMQPDAVVIATGSSVVPPDIPGADMAKVAMARDVIMGRREVGRKVVIVGGGRVGCETALLLARRGKDVTLVRMTGRGRLAGDVGILSRGFLLRELRESRVTIEADSCVEAITREGVVIGKDGASIPIEADTVILSPAPSPDHRLAAQLRERVPELYVIGDADTPRTIADAIREGFRVGREL